MPHTLIVGMTESGKTTLARKLADNYRARGIPIIVLDPYLSSAWGADFITDSPDEFLSVVKSSTSCALFMDECGHYVDDGFDKQLRWLATNSRHYGHNSHFITQRAKQLKPTVRDQCTHLFMFKQSYDDAKELTRNFATDELLEAPSLKKGEYLGKVGIDGQVFRGRVFSLDFLSLCSLFKCMTLVEHFFRYLLAIAILNFNIDIKNGVILKMKILTSTFLKDVLVVALGVTLGAVITAKVNTLVK